MLMVPARAHLSLLLFISSFSSTGIALPTTASIEQLEQIPSSFHHSPGEHSWEAEIPTSIGIPRETSVRRSLAPGPLWGDDTVPNIGDIVQTTIPGCGLTSALCALVALDKTWITNLVTFTGDSASTTSATVNLFDSKTLKSKSKVIPKSALSGERSDAQDGWWVGAVEQAVRESAPSISLFPATALQMITGRAAKVYYSETAFPNQQEAINKEQAWEIIRTAKLQPLVFQSSPSGTTHIWPGHAWAIVGGHGGVAKGESRWVTIYNPWGIRETWDLEAVWPDLYLIHALVGGASEKPAGGAPAVPTSPKSSCAGHTTTGPVPYARWTNLDYDALTDTIYTPDVATRADCIKLCELEKRCLVSTYNPHSLGCFKATTKGVYFRNGNGFEATVKGITCEAAAADAKQWPDATCCTEYHAATPV